MRITLPDNSVKEFDQPVTARQVAAEIGRGLAESAIGARVNGQLVDIDSFLTNDGALTIITRPRTDKHGRSKEDPGADALFLLRHSAAHVMAEAVCKLWPEAALAYGPPVENGFYYDIFLDTPISSDDFARIEEQMSKIIADDRPFTRYDLSRDDGLKKIEDEGNKYKIDNALRALEGDVQTLSWYVTGPSNDVGTGPKKVGGNSEFWEDLCRGPHLPSTGAIGAYKVMSVASSYWHGDVHSDRFQRVYGTAFFTPADLEAHLALRDEAKKRDHRVIGKRLRLFHLDEQVGQGLVLWLPRGAVIRQELQNFICQHLRKQGYCQVFTPHIGKLELFKTSGHYPYYQDSQYPPLISADQVGALAQAGASCGELANRMGKGDIEGYLLKPMNCPHHIRIYTSQKQSYRDLPVRLAEFGTVYRWEQSGEIGGMTRVRGFTQDDAHLFCTEDQLADELLGCLALVKIIFGTLNMTDYRIRVGLRDVESDKYVGDASNWVKAEAACLAAAQSLGVEFTAEVGEAAFYGPKIDFIVKDAIGREWQLGTVQVDYNLPERFNLSYIGPDNQPHRPVMIHRAPFGSMERFIGVLIEHFSGAFPLWLSPEQMRVLPISDKFLDYGHKVLDALNEAGFRASLDDSNDRIQAKIKVAQELQINYMLIVGGRDEKATTVSIRDRSRGDLGAMGLETFLHWTQRELDTYGREKVAVKQITNK